MHVGRKGIQDLLRKPEHEPLGRIGRIMWKSMFERNTMGRLDLFC
jgi:hypothetical protein